jgi:rfaE bifunctional protein kinase chain/domain
MSAVDRPGLLRAVDRMAGVPVLVVADLVLDVFEYGTIGRISREAPVLILEHLRTVELPGGGANAAHNLAALGGRPVVVGRVGADAAGDALVERLGKSGADVDGIWREPGYETPMKRRILAGSAHSVKQQVVRVDRGGGRPVADAAALAQRVASRAAATRGTLISDYSYGLLHPGTIPAVQQAAGAPARPLFVDSRAQLRLFRGLTAATPNLQEAEAFAARPLESDPAGLPEAARALRQSLGATALVVTLGSHGMLLLAGDAPAARIPVYGTDEVADVTGAGDTVIATLTLAVLSGASWIEAALLANYAGGIVVMKRGTATVTPAELRAAITSDPDPAGRIVAS